MFGFGLVFGSSFLSPPSVFSSLPSTMTWAPCPHGVRTRGKKNSVSAPGCGELGYKAFAECCSLQWVYASEGVANRFSNEAKLGHCLFQGCINLAEFTLSELPSPRGSTLQAGTSELAPGCLSSTGITTLALTKYFTTIGALFLPATLHTIRVKAFMNCSLS